MGEYDELHMRRYVAARARGDEPAAHGHWRALVTGNYDRISNFVRSESHGHLSPHEQDDALQRCLEEMLGNLYGGFRGQSVGEFVRATRRLVHFRCIDEQRAGQSAHERVSSLDAGAGGDEEERHGGWERELYRKALDEQSIADAERADRDLARYGGAFLDWALPQLRGKRRQVLELDRDGLEIDAIREQLGCSAGVVYQSRKRGLRDLERLRQEYRDQ